MPTLQNRAEGGTEDATVTTGNSGGASGSAWDTVTISAGGALTYDNEHARNDRAYKVVGSTSNVVYLIWTSSLGTVGEVWGRFYLCLTAAPASATGIMRLRVGGVQTMRIQMNTAGQLEVRKNSGNTNIGTITTAVPTDQWVRIEWHCLATTTSADLECRLYTDADSSTITDQFSATAETLTNANIDEFNLGQHTVTTSATYWLDDVQINTTGWPGPSTQTISVDQASETDTADTITPAHTAAVGQASETDTAEVVTPVISSGAVQVGQAEETDTAGAVTPSRTVAVGLAEETDTAHAVTAVHTVPVGQAEETDTAGAVAFGAITVLVQTAVESDTASGVYARRTFMGFGILAIERIALRETFSVGETTGSPRRLTIRGEESSPPLERSEVIRRHDQMLGLRSASLVQFTLADKPERNGYYLVRSVDTDLTEYRDAVVKTVWTIELSRVGGESETDLESRLTGIARANDFALTGERWHAPAIGHYAYYLGATIPSTMTRSTDEGDITVYRSLPSGALAPRWGCTPEAYLLGRVRVLSEGLERTGMDIRVDPTDWELSNALTRVRPFAGGVEVAAWDGTQWESKNWTVRIGSTVVSTWDSVTVLRNDYEQCVIRLTKNRAPGRATLDLTLRRGSRLVEGYLQRGDSGTLSVSLTTPETLTDNSAAGYVVATSNDAAGNKVLAGSARSFTAHADGGVSKAATTTVDFFVGVVLAGTSAVSGDTALDVRNQYIASLAEATAAVGR